jgi:hypothetical protein
MRAVAHAPFTCGLPDKPTRSVSTISLNGGCRWRKRTLRSPSGRAGTIFLPWAPRPRSNSSAVSGRADGVRHFGAPRTEWRGRARRGVVGGLVLHLGVELGAQQDDNGRDPEPRYEPITAPSEPQVSLNFPKLVAYQENRPEATSHMIVAAAPPHVIQRQRGPARLGPVPVDTGEGQRQDDEQGWPARDANDQVGEVGKPEIIQDDGDDPMAKVNPRV